MAAWVVLFTPDNRPWGIINVEANKGVTKADAPLELRQYVEGRFGPMDTASSHPFQGIRGEWIEWPLKG